MAKQGFSISIDTPDLNPPTTGLLQHQHHPVRMRDCINLSFISSYTARPPPDSEHANIATRVRHYAVTLTLALFTISAVVSSYCLATARDAGPGLHVGGPVANILCTWLTAWGLIVLRDVQGSRNFVRFRIAFVERPPHQFALSMGRKFFDFVIYLHLCITVLLFVGLCVKGATEEFARMFLGMAFLQTVLSIGGAVVLIATLPRSLDDEDF